MQYCVCWWGGISWPAAQRGPRTVTAYSLPLSAAGLVLSAAPLLRRCRPAGSRPLTGREVFAHCTAQPAQPAATHQPRASRATARRQAGMPGMQAGSSGAQSRHQGGRGVSPAAGSQTRRPPGRLPPLMSQHAGLPTGLRAAAAAWSAGKSRSAYRARWCMWSAAQGDERRCCSGARALCTHKNPLIAPSHLKPGPKRPCRGRISQQRPFFVASRGVAGWTRVVDRSNAVTCVYMYEQSRFDVGY
jgi:hypothetical protein